ncbi:pyridoxamine 5'-phosphate oxidase family protein [Brevibacillus daliensis]|uniref:pyridoxamine 5'-phosphate oxidase family protein n=1 Tax=Brevibacillus daliensis TaxID=2892995 RepID=UPI001E4FD8EA|nr:pyridoxamine 5'-phosphate oxidase family protein [Brevibacillus daliensis]
MIKTIPQSLSQEQMEFMNDKPLILLSTIDKETNTPSTSAISWVKAHSEKTIRFAVTSNSRTLANLKENSRVSLTMIGLGTVYSIIGEAHLLEEKIDGIAMPLAKLEVRIEAVFESMFWGAAITENPAYEKTTNIEKATALDVQVFTALLN